MYPIPFHRCAAAVIAALAAITLTSAAAAPARAQGTKLDAQYVASLGGIPVGKGSWVVEIGDTSYSATVNGGTVGLLKVFAGGEGTGSVRGTLSGGHPAMSTYSSSLKTEKKNDSVRVLVNAGVVKDFNAEPPLPPDSERVPVTEAHRRGVMDPLTASLVRVPGTASIMGPDACRSVSVFDGRTRYDLNLIYKRMDQVKTEKGYQGPVVICAIQFKPIAGFIMSRSAVKYLVAQREMEVWLAPVAGTRVMVPYRISIPTPIGLALLEAHEFVASTRAAANVKSQ